MLGYDSVAKFAERLCEVFEEELDRLLQSIENGVDTYAFFERQEEWMIKQQCGKEDRDLLWRSNINRYGPCLLKSAACDIERALLTVPEACESLGVSRSKLYDLVSRGLIKTVKLSSGPKAGVRLRPEDLRDYARKQAKTSRNIR